MTKLHWLVRGSSRPMATLSFALNYAADDVNVAGYHFVNVMIHLVAAATLLGVVGRTLRSPALTDRFGTQAPWLAFAVALLWVVHPLTTQTVNYIIQRGESMMAMFYLLTVYCALRSAAMCGTTPPAFSIIRLEVGTARLMRRPGNSRVKR